MSLASCTAEPRDTSLWSVRSASFTRPSRPRVPPNPLSTLSNSPPVRLATPPLLPSSLPAHQGGKNQDDVLEKLLSEGAAVV